MDGHRIAALKKHGFDPKQDFPKSRDVLRDSIITGTSNTKPRAGRLTTQGSYLE